MRATAKHKIGLVAALGLVLACIAAIFLGWLSEEMLEGDTSRFDAQARAAIHSASSPTFTTAMWFFTDVGSVVVLTLIFAATVAVFWIVRWRAASVLLVITMAGAAVLDESLKLGFHRHRPVPFFGITAPHSFSYPSGHSLFSFVFFSTVASVSAARVSRPWIRAVIWAAGVLFVVLIGFSRIYLGVHYPTDVIAGYATGLIWVIAVSLADRLYQRRYRRR